jgi:hypothetical protein
MAGEIQYSFKPGTTSYALIRNRAGQIWSTSGGTGAFESYDNDHYADYDITTTEQGASAYFVGSLPAAIPAGVYNIVGKQQLGGSPAQTDPTVAMGDLQWNGTVVLPLSDLTTSGQLARVTPVAMARSEMVPHYPIYLVSAADHVTPMTSGVVSGQIARDNGSFTALQSGAITERGLGTYTVQALTSGDLDARTARLVFTAAGVSGGTSDPLVINLVLQRSSGLY